MEEEEDDEEETRGEVPGKTPPPELFWLSPPPFLAFLMLDLGESALEGRLLACLLSVPPPPPPPPPPGPPPLGLVPSILASFRVSLGSLNAALGGALLSSFTLISGFFEDEEDENDEGSRLPLLLLSRSASPLEELLLSESFLGRSRCSLASL